MPVEVADALAAVREVFPEVDTVVFTSNAKWLYFDSETGDSPAFAGLIDVGILEDAADAVDNFPAVYQLQP